MKKKFYSIIAMYIMLIVAIAFIGYYSEVKTRKDKDIAFRSGYAKALHMKKLPKRVY